MDVPVGNLVDAQKTLRVVLRRAFDDVGEEAAPAVEDETAGAAAAAAAARDFEPSATFSGSRPGRVFRRSYLGQGYYVDARAPTDDVFEASDAYRGPRPGRFFTTRRQGAGYYVDAPPMEQGALVVRQFTPPPPNGRVFSKSEFDALRTAAPPDLTLCVFFETGDEADKLRDAYGAMARRFWPRALLLRAGVATDLAKSLRRESDGVRLLQGRPRVRQVWRRRAGPPGQTGQGDARSPKDGGLGRGAVAEGLTTPV